MAITRKYGARAVAKLGKLAGEAKAQAAGAARAERVAAASRAAIAQREETLLRIEADKERTKFNIAVGLEAEKRAKTWELEKMSLRSQANFAREERQRNQALDAYESTEKYIDEHADDFSEQQLKQARFDNEVKLNNSLGGLTGQASRQQPTEKTGSVFNLLGDEQPADAGLPSASDPAGLNIPAAGKGSLVAESVEQQQLVKDKQFKVISPDGDQEIIESSEWPVKKEQGYLLAEIYDIRRDKERQSQYDKIVRENVRESF